MLELSIVMINYNHKELTLSAVESILSCSPALSYEILLADNSEDEREHLKRTDFPKDAPVVLLSLKNRGFGNACNIGAAKAAGNFLLFLNSDTLMQKGTLEACVFYLKAHSDVGVLGERTLLSDGTLDHACKRGFPTPSASLFYFLGWDKWFPKSRTFGAYRATWLSEDAVGQVDAVAGSFLMMPSSIFWQVGGFDEDFFMYGEDLDLCYRVKQAGYLAVYYGKASITHLKGQSGLHTRSEAVIRHFYRAMELFYQKHYEKKYGPLLSKAVYYAIRKKREKALKEIR